MANICTNLFFCSTENKENLKTVENYMTDTVFRSIFSVSKSSTCCLRSGVPIPFFGRRKPAFG